MCGPEFRPPPYNKTREDANLLPISKPFVSWRTFFKTNQCFLQCKLGCISTFWQPIDKPKDKFIGNYAFCKNAIYIKTNFQIKKGPLQNLRAWKSTLSGPHIPVPTFPLSTPPPRNYSLWNISCVVEPLRLLSIDFKGFCFFQWIWWKRNTVQLFIDLFAEMHWVYLKRICIYTNIEEHTRKSSHTWHIQLVCWNARQQGI